MTLLLRHDVAAGLVALVLSLEPVPVSTTSAPDEHLALSGTRVVEVVHERASALPGHRRKSAKLFRIVAPGIKEQKRIIFKYHGEYQASNSTLTFGF